MAWTWTAMDLRAAAEGAGFAMVAIGKWGNRGQGCISRTNNSMGRVAAGLAYA